MPLREIVFDTETTGRSPDQGDRVVEIGCIEIIDLTPTGKNFHVYINPEREVPEEVVKVHGLTTAFLSKHPVFADPRVVDRFLDFIEDSPLVAHNAEFDRKFINAEFVRLGKPEFPQARFVDTLPMAKKKFPGAQASLDALCKRFNISLTNRDLHGALIDARLLAEVYLELQGGREQKLAFIEEAAAAAAADTIHYPPRQPRPAPLPSRIAPEEAEAHAAFIAKIGDKALWGKA
jgi:DNA polymerase III subunit epsilon